jgi:hypothetical protein
MELTKKEIEHRIFRNNVWTDDLFILLIDENNKIIEENPVRDTIYDSKLIYEEDLKLITEVIAEKIEKTPKNSIFKKIKKIQFSNKKKILNGFNYLFEINPHKEKLGKIEFIHVGDLDELVCS